MRWKTSHLFLGKPYGDDNNDLYNNEDYQEGQDDQVIYTLPQFITKPQNFMVNEGATIRLPCVLDRLGK